MKFDYEELEKLMKLMQSYGLQEVQIKSKDSEVTLKQPKVALPGSGMQPMPGYFGGQTIAAASTPQQVPQTPPLQVPEPKQTAAAPQGKLIRSPFVGTYYASPSPEADPFVKVGDRIKKGDTLCIVEAMKIMNEIEADESGVIKEILVSNEEPVEFDQPLFILE